MFHQYKPGQVNLSRAKVYLTESQFYACWTLSRFGWTPTSGTLTDCAFAYANLDKFAKADTVAAFMQKNGIEVIHV